MPSEEQAVQGADRLSEKEKMLTGQLYRASDPELEAERLKAATLLQAYNAAGNHKSEEQPDILKELLGAIGERTVLRPPFYCDYGYAADHPRDPHLRRQGLELGRSISVGRNVWIGAGALILPGVTIGDDAVVGAGSVVTRAVAPGATVAGNPARERRSSGGQ
jgi:maltose O-acetyltransferase